MKRLAGLADLIGTCDAMLVDQFGTLHDGSRLYPGAADALARLKAAGIRVVILSNSGKRAAPNADRLARLGIAPDLYDSFLTSGEAGWRMLVENRVPGVGNARHCLLLSRGDDQSLLAGTGLAAVTDAGTADLIVIAGSEGEHRPLAEYHRQLAPFARRGVPALCLNPDRIMLTEAGPAFGAGQIADEYTRLGGSVVWIGKPYPSIYQAAMALLPGIPPDRIAGIGDSVEHDVAGANNAGCQAILVRSGIIASMSDADVKAECARWQASPDALLARFAW